ncbi:MerR family transcriptional regulator [Hoyosella sp. YIM 151337]|uniref:MerR family transcriptional regulator n=1 Tax=Hoyosella sp. YIM 151337 TaxID=2992742 RepID=UPI0022360960|nr:MerR family transcriptional regulator [Hoyosella sp. YIM 151337]MCW4354904.1 MerR family transcriptional regulator [Hoyosella sp. YIM 151337]
MPEYRIDDLARAAGVTTRNVRAYKERGLLPEPHRQGRTNFYDDSHLERLKLINTLLQRGFTINHIADFIAGWENGKSLAEILGLPGSAAVGWVRDETLEVPLAAVRARLGRDSELLDQLVAMKMARIDGDTVEFAEPQLVQAFVELQQFGFELRPLIRVMADVAERTNEIAQIMIRAALEVSGPERHDQFARPHDVARAIDQLKQLTHVAVRSVHILLARAVDENLKRGLNRTDDEDTSTQD